MILLFRLSDCWLDRRFTKEEDYLDSSLLCRFLSYIDCTSLRPGAVLISDRCTGSKVNTNMMNCNHMTANRERDPDYYLWGLSPWLKLSLILEPFALFSTSANVMLFVFWFALGKLAWLFHESLWNICHVNYNWQDKNTLDEGYRLLWFKPITVWSSLVSIIMARLILELHLMSLISHHASTLWQYCTLLVTQRGLYILLPQHRFVVYIFTNLCWWFIKTYSHTHLS